MSENHNNSSTLVVKATEPCQDQHDGDVEAQPRNTQKRSSHWQLVIDQIHVTPEVADWPYKGSGTERDPYVVIYIENDRRNPMLFSKLKKWFITVIIALVRAKSLQYSIVFQFVRLLN
jgi:hypothetical protein